MSVSGIIEKNWHSISYYMPENVVQKFICSVMEDSTLGIWAFPFVTYFNEYCPQVQTTVHVNILFVPCFLSGPVYIS